MWSIAIFPCSFTGGATLVGELVNSLQLPVYSDALLFEEVSEQFGIPVEKQKKVILGRRPPLRRYMLRKQQYINCLRCTLDATLDSSRGRLHYGFHTSLFDITNRRVLRVLVCDDWEDRVKRAVLQEGIGEAAAREMVADNDQQASEWTHFLFGKPPYDTTLHDIVIRVDNRSLLSLVSCIAACFNEFRASEEILRPDTISPVVGPFQAQQM
ncbi:cytidylate kinase family protein [Desulforhopalus singaporensis]|uniref:Cytidylate kinase-like family protein n=1 Tax=Desulforhopalus singaporensis TaxID=91360 RepID=A0A1H0ST02_9BACT|nr:cytidylate kinase family protein [Desulforhopalus singaporensis]SDP44814.1 Cytidylate kinase-like family protein [Desulforhopalus singaporensis]